MTDHGYPAIRQSDFYHRQEQEDTPVASGTTGLPATIFPEDVVLTERDGSWWDSAGLEWAEMDSVTWFGSMGYSNFSTPEDEMEEGRECPVCHQNVPLAQWYELIFCGEKPPDPGWSGVLESGKWQVRIVDRTTPWSWEEHCVQV